MKRKKHSRTKGRNKERRELIEMKRAFRRRAEKRTDYDQRLGLLKSGMTRTVIRMSNAYASLQAVDYIPSGDKTVASLTSKALRKYGWLGDLKSIPSDYLTGLLFGMKLRKLGIKKTIADIGLQRAAAKGKIFAVVKGIKDSGIEIPLGKEAEPDAGRLSGKHIAEYAKKIASTPSYQKQFSAYIRRGLKPEEIETHFEQVRKKILADAGK